MTEKYSGSILVVDDNTSVLEMTAELLEMAGFTVTRCSDSTQALELLGELEPDLMITDVIMPQITGTELVHAMRNFSVEIPVIIMTGYAELDMLFDAIRLQVFDVIRKPFKPQELTAAAARAVNYRREQLRLHRQVAASSANNIQPSLTQGIASIANDLAAKLTQLRTAEDLNLERQQLDAIWAQAGYLAMAIKNHLQGSD